MSDDSLKLLPCGRQKDYREDSKGCRREREKKRKEKKKRDNRSQRETWKDFCDSN